MEYKIPHSNLKIYYKSKKFSKNQLEFITNLYNNINDNNCAIHEFPPTLDKDFLYNSVLFSLAKQLDKKFIILVKNYDKIYEILNNFSKINTICKKFYDNKTEYENLKIVPYFERKILCLNDKLIETASTLDFDSYCINSCASWVSEENKCIFYKVFINII